MNRKHTVIITSTVQLTSVALSKSHSHKQLIFVSFYAGQ